ncbi:anthranilate synthase component II [Halodesulfovibrio spirochaetisodalis]|uniref:Anthranilate synthase subunit II n=1 Tax=Halodesulfovibrio spirochaetisodalis TaxID=1560234 RepID=A0A1B7XG95_9BACT|nr:aminodeoxychorismate/anthranilate synthase component II [Halodesulfovibrio spirochaetisodalis]OBQ54546.1 anthranilate synthase subunit II [Halodesulfovibrio spirochaetisodalis]
MFLLIDNYDSFTFNLVQAFQKTGRYPHVVRNDNPELLELAQSGTLEMVCISPGPGKPENAGLCLEFLNLLPKEVPVLGVCLGHQVLAHFAGATVDIAPRIMHGKHSDIVHNGKGLFEGLKSPMQVARYHSLIITHSDDTVLVPTSSTQTPNGEEEIMSIAYADRPWVGVQFHPESILTPQGEAMLKNFPDKVTAGSS